MTFEVKWRHTCTSVETLQEMAESVTRSYKNGHNIPQLVDEKHVVFYDWASLSMVCGSLRLLSPLKLVAMI
jgi:hypothetical protein